MKVGKTVTCDICGKHFIAPTRKTKYCSDECRKIKAKRDWHNYDKKPTVEKQAPIVTETLDEILQQLDEYNAENNTCLSYGQFVEMKRREKELKERSRK